MQSLYLFITNNGSSLKYHFYYKNYIFYPNNNKRFLKILKYKKTNALVNKGYKRFVFLYFKKVK